MIRVFCKTSITFVYLTLSLVAAQRSDIPATTKKVAKPGSPTPQGCFRSPPSTWVTTNEQQSIFNSVGSCVNQCKGDGKAVAVMRERACLCGDVYPQLSSLVEDSACNYPCPGYPMESCGGPCSYNVWNTGLQVDVAYAQEDRTYLDEVISSAWDYGKSAAVGAYWIACSYSNCLWPESDAKKGISDSESEVEKCLKLENKAFRVGGGTALSVTGRSDL